MKAKIILSALICLVTISVLFIQACKKEDKVNKIPSCKITSPLNGQEITKGAIVTIAVEGTDSDGNITEVQFFIDGASKNTANNAPFQYNWNTTGENTGTHTIKATSFDNRGDSASDSIIVVVLDSVVNTAPIASFTVSHDSGTINTIFVFDASTSTDIEDDTSQLQVRWDFNGNGDWDTEWDFNKIQNYQYEIEGPYLVKMEVKDTEGLTGETTDSITVIDSVVNTAPTASFTVSPDSGTINTIFVFDASTSTDIEDDTSQLQVRWDFNGNGDWDTEWDFNKTQNFQYETEGSISIKMEVKDTEGLVGETTQTIAVNSLAGTFTDPRDGQTYNTIVIGDQTWFAENLNYKFNATWWYQNDSLNGDIYGRLYDFVHTQWICPEGWHCSTNDEWARLLTYLGEDAGQKLKSTSGWYDNGNGIDLVGFSALPGGNKHHMYGFQDIGQSGYFWTSTPGGSGGGVLRELRFNSKLVHHAFTNMSRYLSIRCVKDE